MTRKPKPQPFPRGKQQVRLHTPNERVFTVTVDWDHVADLARRAANNKGRSARFGPIAVRLEAES